MKISTIVGIVIGCLGILVTMIVSLRRSGGISQTQKDTKESKQEIKIQKP